MIELRARLARTRWPEAAPAPGWAQGVPLEVVQDLCRYWAEEYEWRSAEARLNTVPQYLVGVDGLKVHVLHARSAHPGALPLVLTHGWPGSVLELVDLVGPLTDPVRHGGVRSIRIGRVAGHVLADVGRDRSGAASTHRQGAGEGQGPGLDTHGPGPGRPCRGAGHR